MGDRAKEARSHARGPHTPRVSLSAAAPLALFSLTTGGIAVGMGALATLPVSGSPARALVWLVVTFVVAAGAGLWWGLTPVRERLRVLDRAVAVVHPRGSHSR